jgi:glutamine amidotransferase
VIAVLDYGIGNLRSAQKGLQRVGADAVLTDDPAVVRAADGVVLPGVGAFGRCMEALRATGLEEPAREAIDAGVPFFGICVGMQMLYDGSEEDPDAKGMGVLAGTVRRLPDGVKRPQMQWNVLDHGPTPMLAGIDDPAWVYFVHSFAPEPSPDVVATCDYGGPVVAAVQRDTLWATQFHPEKSGATGLRILANFVAAAASSSANR